MALAKAYLDLIPATQALSGGPSGGVGSPAVPVGFSGGNRIDFQFNPETLEITKTAKWKRQPVAGSDDVTIAEYKGPEPMKLSLKMLLDDSYAKSPGTVVDRVEMLFQCCTPTSDSKVKKLPSPPFVRFGWGSKLSLLGVITTVKASYTLFDPEGTPIRAECDITVEEMPSVKKGQNPTSGSHGPRRRRWTVVGDSLPLIAYGEYRDPRYWRALAVLNGIDDPMRLAP